MKSKAYRMGLTVAMLAVLVESLGAGLKWSWPPMVVDGLRWGW